MNFEELKTNVEEWAKDKDLLHEENAEKQFMKFVEEVFEFKTEMDIWKLYKNSNMMKILSKIFLLKKLKDGKS